MNTNYRMRNVNGHVEIYSESGVFLFSADNEAEAEKDLEFFLAA